MKCIHCHKEITRDYRRDETGAYYCNDECYEAFNKKYPQQHDDFSHPYMIMKQYARSICIG